MFDKNYLFFRGYLYREMAVDGDPGLFAETEVVRAVCNADFRKNGFLMMKHSSSPNCYYKYAKTPMGGLYMLRAVKKSDLKSLDILIDTRFNPCLLLIENSMDWQDETEEIINTLEQSFNEDADVLNWHVTIKESGIRTTQNIHEIVYDLEYMNNPDDVAFFNRSNVHIGQLIMEVKGDNLFNDGFVKENSQEVEPPCQPADEEVVEKLKPLFYNNEENVKRFLKEIENMSPNNITDLVNQWVKDNLISDYGNSRKGDLWKILHDAKLYPWTIQNWNRRVF